MTLELWFKADAGGVIATELGQTAINTAWHDTHIELAPNGHVMVRVWPLNAVDLGTVTFGTWHHAAVRYNAATNILDGALDGVPSANTVSGARQQPNTNAQY